MITTKSYFMRPLALLVLALLAASVMMMLGRPAQAANFVVSNTNDAGAGSLRDAIAQANASTGVEDTIKFDLGSAATITLATRLPAITDPGGLPSTARVPISS